MKICIRHFSYADISVHKFQSHVKGKKVKLSLGLTKHHSMKTYWGVEA